MIRVEIGYRGARGGRKRVEFYTEITSAEVRTDGPAALLSVRTSDGLIELLCSSGELDLLKSALNRPPSALFDFEPELYNHASSGTPDAIAAEYDRAMSRSERLLSDRDLIEEVSA